MYKPPIALVSVLTVVKVRAGDDELVLVVMKRVSDERLETPMLKDVIPVDAERDTLLKLALRDRFAVDTLSRPIAVEVDRTSRPRLTTLSPVAVDMERLLIPVEVVIDRLLSPKDVLCDRLLNPVDVEVDKLTTEPVMLLKLTVVLLVSEDRLMLNASEAAVDTEESPIKVDSDKLLRPVEVLEDRLLKPVEVAVERLLTELVSVLRLDEADKDKLLKPIDVAVESEDSPVLRA